MQQLQSHLRHIGTPTLYRSGTSLYFQGEVPRHAVMILDGTVKAYMISNEDAEVIVHLFGKGAIIPSGWVSEQSPTALFNYDAHSDVRALKFTRQDFYDALEKSHEFETEYRRYLARSQTSLLLRVTGLTQARAAEKICYTLYYLLFRYGIEKRPGIYEINLKLTQGMLAQLIGQTRESTAKNLKALKKTGLVEYASSTYFVNKPKLEAYLGEDSFRELLQ